MLLVATAISSHCLATNQALNEASEYFKEDSLNDAYIKLQQALSTHPNDPTILYNLALVEFKQGQVGWSLAHNEKSLSMDPTNSNGHRLKRALSKIILEKNGDLIFQIPPYYNWTDMVPSWILACFISLVFLFLFYSLGGLFYKARILYENPSEEQKTFFIALFLLFLSGGLFLVKFKTQQDPWICSVNEKSPIHSGPNFEHRRLDIFKEGECVKVVQVREGWAGVISQNNRIGWVNLSDFAHARGKKIDSL